MAPLPRQMQHHLIHVYEHYERPQAIGNSSKAPWPNLKKLIDPASTAATTTCFFPDLSTMNGFGFQVEAIVGRWVPKL